MHGAVALLFAQEWDIEWVTSHKDLLTWKDHMLRRLFNILITREEERLGCGHKEVISREKT